MAMKVVTRLHARSGKRPVQGVATIDWPLESLRHFTLTYEADPTTKPGAGYPHDEALAISAVEVVEGQSRELARKRRRPSS